MIVGRDGVVEDMLAACALAEAGRRQVLFVTGEAGVGKTTVLRAFRARLSDRGPSERPGVSVSSTMAPANRINRFLDALGRLCRQPGAEDVIQLLERYSPTWLAQLPTLLPPERLDRLRRLLAGTTRERMLRELSDALEAITARVPLVLWLEDLHWSDMSTLDWIAAFAQRPEPACLLLIGTFRPLSDHGARTSSGGDNRRLSG